MVKVSGANAKFSIEIGRSDVFPACPETLPTDSVGAAQAAADRRPPTPRMRSLWASRVTPFVLMGFLRRRPAGSADTPQRCGRPRARRKDRAFAESHYTLSFARFSLRYS